MLFYSHSHSDIFQADDPHHTSFSWEQFRVFQILNPQGCILLSFPFLYYIHYYIEPVVLVCHLNHLLNFPPAVSGSDPSKGDSDLEEEQPAPATPIPLRQKGNPDSLHLRLAHGDAKTPWLKSSHISDFRAQHTSNPNTPYRWLTSACQPLQA